MRWCVLLVGTSGCPMIWGPPQLYTGPGPEGVGVRDSGEVRPEDTGPVPISPLAPEVQRIELDLRLDHIELRLHMSDPDGDLLGGVLTWSENGVDQPELSIPEDFDAWDPELGLATLRGHEVPRGCGVDALAFEYVVVPVDSAGHAGAPGLERIDIAVIGDPVDNADLGVIRAPAMLCGSFTEEDQRDRFDFIHEPGSDWFITLDHDVVEIDVDLALRDETLVAETSSPDVPDTTWAGLASGQAYELEVRRDQENITQHYVVTFHR